MHSPATGEMSVAGGCMPPAVQYGDPPLPQAAAVGMGADAWQGG